MNVTMLLLMKMTSQISRKGMSSSLVNQFYAVHDEQNKSQYRAMRETLRSSFASSHSHQTASSAKRLQSQDQSRPCR